MSATVNLERISIILANYYDENWRELENGYASDKPYVQSIESVYAPDLEAKNRMDSMLDNLIEYYQQRIKKIAKAALHPGIGKIEKDSKERAAASTRVFLTDLKRLKRSGKISSKNEFE